MRGRNRFLLTLVAGIALVVVGILLSAPVIGPNDGPAHSNPRMAFAPLVAMVGAAVTFLSPLVYALAPD
jgi:hypothetical protein